QLFRLPRRAWRRGNGPQPARRDLVVRAGAGKHLQLHRRRPSARNASMGRAHPRQPDLGADRVHPIAADEGRAGAAAMKRRIALLALLGGCASEYDALSPAGPAARKLADLGWPMLLFFVVTSAVMRGLLLWVAIRRSGTLAEHAS